MPSDLSAHLITFLLQLPVALQPQGYQRLFTPLVTLYYLIRQQLTPGLSMQAVVADLHQGGANAFSGPQPLSQKIVSLCTCAYSKARRRLRLGALRRILQWQGTSAGPRGWARFWNREVRLLDGSTVTLRPYGNVPRYFPAHSATRGEGYWCLMRVVVSFCARTGLALDSASGSKHASEQALARRLLRSVQAGVIYVADRNFGVLGVVQAMVATKADALVRLTDRRAAKLLGQAPVAGLDQPVRWQRSAKEQADATVVTGRVLCVQLARPGFRPFLLCLFTTLTDPAVHTVALLAELYGWRWRVELNLRHLKTQLGLAKLEVHSAQMAKRQWLAGLLAYNLTRQTLLAAAQTHAVPVATLSFRLALTLLVRFLMQTATAPDAPETVAHWQTLLAVLAGVGPPPRTKSRPAEPHAVRYLARSFPPLRGCRAKARPGHQPIPKC